MSLYLKQNESRSDLQKRIAGELQDKARKKAIETERPDGVMDSAYIKDTKQTTSLAWVWVVIIVAIIGIALWLILSTL